MVADEGDMRESSASSLTPNLTFTSLPLPGGFFITLLLVIRDNQLPYVELSLCAGLCAKHPSHTTPLSFHPNPAKF